MRPRAEACGRLTVGQLRRRVEAGAPSCQLADGTALALRWAPVRGCFGGRGRALVMICPVCEASCRVIWRPPGQGWGCWRCRPVSHRSHRRPGSRRGRPKPTRWRLEQIATEQRRCTELLALEHWPPQRLFWSWRHLLVEPRRPGAPVLSAARELALAQRCCALETLRVAALLPGIDAELRGWGHELPPWPSKGREVAAAKRLLEDTAWSVRRPAGDPRKPRAATRGGVAATTDGIASTRVCDCYSSKSGEFAETDLAHSATTDRVQTSRRWQSWQPNETRNLRCESVAPNSRGFTESPKPRG